MQEKNSPSDPPSTTTGPGLKDYLSQAPDEAIYLKIIIQPRASKNSVIGPCRDALKVKVTSPPVDGEANKNLVALISKLLHVPKTSIRIKQGLTSKNKLLLIKGITLNEAQGYIDAAAAKNKK